MTTTSLAETAEAGETTDLNFATAFDYAALAPLNQQYGAYETVSWSASLGANVTGVVSVSPISGSGTLSAGGPVVAITVAPNAVTGDTFTINASETLSELGANVTDNFAFNYTIVAGPNSPGPTPELPNIPAVPTNAAMQQTAPGVLQTGDYHVASSGAWAVDNRTAAAGDDASYYSGTSMSSLQTAVGNTVVAGVANKISGALQGLGQTASTISGDFSAIGSTKNPVTILKTYIQNIANTTFGALDSVASSNPADPSDTQLLQQGEQQAAQIVPLSAQYISDEQQYYQDTDQTAPASLLQFLQTAAPITDDSAQDWEVGNSVSASLVDPGTVVNAGTTAGIIVGGAGNETIVLHGGLDYVYANGGNDTIDMSLSGLSDFIYGGSGADTVFFPYARSHYSLVATNSASGFYWTVSDLTPNQAGDDLLFNIKTIAFANRTVSYPEPAASDFWGAGSDVLFLNPNGALALWELNNTAVIGGGIFQTLGAGWTVSGTGDFNGDGKSDILLSTAAGALAIWEMSGASVIGGGKIGQLGSGWNVVGAGDFNGDGHADVLFQNASGALGMWAMNGTQIIGGSSDFVNLGANSGWRVAGTGDFNGDGKADILLQNANGAVALWEMNGASVTGGGIFANLGANSGWNVVGTGDFNGDGNCDIVLENSSGAVALWEMNGTSVIGGGVFQNLGAGSGWSVAGVGDYNGDGLADILLHNTGGSTAIWDMNGASVTGGGVVGQIAAPWIIQHS